MSNEVFSFVVVVVFEGLNLINDVHGMIFHLRIYSSFLLPPSLVFKIIHAQKQIGET